MVVHAMGMTRNMMILASCLSLVVAGCGATKSTRVVTPPAYIPTPVQVGPATADTSSKLDKADKTHDAVTGNVKTLKGQLDKAMQDADSARREAQRLADLGQASKQELAKLLEQDKQMQADIAAADTEIETLSARNDQLTKDLADTRASMEALKLKAAQADLTAGNLKKIADAEKSDILTLQEQARKKDDQIAVDKNTEARQRRYLWILGGMLAAIVLVAVAKFLIKNGASAAI